MSNHFFLGKFRESCQKPSFSLTKVPKHYSYKKSKYVNSSAKNKSYKEHIYSKGKGGCWNFDFAPPSLQSPMSAKCTVTFYEETHMSTKNWTKIF